MLDDDYRESLKQADSEMYEAEKASTQLKVSSFSTEELTLPGEMYLSSEQYACYAHHNKRQRIGGDRGDDDHPNPAHRLSCT